MKTKRVKKFFAIMLSVSMVMSTMNLTALADAIKSSDSTISLSEMISRSAEVKDDGSCEIALTIEAEDYEEMVQSDSDAEEKECTCEMIATDSNCTATDSNCEENGCTCGTAGKKSRSKNAYKYHDVEITDYTSKWVNLDTTSFKIWDGSTVIYEYDTEAGEYAWADGVEKLTSGKPVIYCVVDEADYNEDDLAVYGNEKNDIYEIIWNVKDGALTEEDCYKLTYSVKADTEEPGFSYDTEYPTNGMTVVSYKNAKGKTVEIELDELPVPVIEVSQNYDALGNTASKKSELVSRRENRYKINLSVPGEDVPDVHDEVIIMVDGSYSGDDEWPNTRKAIIEIGESVLDGAGNTQLTLMTFGMGDNIVLEQIKTVDELENQLTELPGGLLYGRSSTNCEAGFTGIQEYIEENEEDLNQVHVIYITDGEINTDETPYDFYQWKSNAWLKRDIRTLIQWSVEEELAYITYEQTPEDDELYGPYVPTVASEAFMTVFGTEVDYKNFNTSTVTDEQYIQWADLVWEDVYDEAGLTPGEEYPVSDVERAFVSYDKAHNTHVQEAWYYTLWGRSYPNRWTRTPEAATTLAAMDEVEHLYMVDTNGATSWMNPDNSDESSNNVVGENVSFTYNANVNNLAAKLADILSEIAKTQYNDVVITDYMSKWVNLDKDSIKVIDDSTGNAIYSSKEGWLIDEDERPVDSGVPVEIELVPEEEYDEDDTAVDGNTSGDIYKLTWKVKEGGLLRSDRYHLEYEVIVDTEEAGFVYGKDYPANGITTVSYKDGNGVPQEEEIDVPDVDTAVGNDPTEGTKVDKLLDRSDDLYEVKVSVPGAETESYDEIILMIDASSSQFENIDDLKKTLVEIGENVLNENGTMHLTLMHFGIGATTPYSGDMYSIFTATSQKDLTKKLENVDYSVIERWPTGTNCEGSFNHLQDYIENSPNLENAYIIYTSDGETNISDEPRLWSDWKNYPEWHWKNMGAANIITQTMIDECNNINAGADISEPTKQIFGDIVAAYGSDLAGMTAALKEAVKDETKANAWVDLAWQMAYEANGLTSSESYPVSTIEGAFIKTFGMEGTWHFHFAYASLASSYEGHHGSYRAYEKGHRAATACNELAEMDQVEAIYLLGMNGNGGNSCLTSWMNASEENKANNTAKVFADHEKITFIDCTKDNKAETLMAELEYLGNQISLMPMNNVAVVDYMSKWVNLDLNSIKILDGDKVIYAYNETTGQYEWLISESECPTTKTPIIVELVDAAEYEKGGSDVEGNTSGDIYRITWNIKDGALRMSDNYHMTYRVTVDTNEAGFDYEKDYPANGNTTVEYTDEKGTRNYDPIDVPDVNAEEPDPATAAKADELIDRDTNKYRVTISVPGADGEKIHDEVILMVDGSYSLDDEWPAMKEAIVGIAEELLNGKGNTQLTLMAFGMGDNEVAVHVKSADEIAKVLGELPGTLLYGRSSTNCEAGLTGIGEYIDAHDESLNDVHVIYITDGNINTDETPYTFYNWTENSWLRYSKENIALWNLQGQCEAILDGLNPAEAFVEVFGADADAETVAATATAEQALEWANLVWADVYEAAGLNPETAYPVSDVERAFVAYDESCNTYVQDLFYYALVGRSYPERWTRTPAAANELAAKEEIESLYFVDYSGYTSWMDTGVTALNSEYIQANGIGNLLESMEDMITDLALMPYQDVVITDYMSKWVNLDTTTIKVVDDSTGTVIYSSEEGWKIDENRPTAQEVPVVVEKVDPADYAEGGTDVEGNTNGDIYKLTWYVKDGALLRSENYHLEYEVTVDTEEEGFNANTAYPANGDTTMEYTDEKGIEHEDPIAVPDVDVPKTEPNPTDPSESESQNPSQPSEPEGNEPTDNRNDDDDDNDNERGRVRGASDENEPETEGFTGAVLGAFDTFEILDDMIPLAVAPATGDLSLIWIALSILSALGLAGTSMIERKKRK